MGLGVAHCTGNRNEQGGEYGLRGRGGGSGGGRRPVPRASEALLPRGAGRRQAWEKRFELGGHLFKLSGAGSRVAMEEAQGPRGETTASSSATKAG